MALFGKMAAPDRLELLPHVAAAADEAVPGSVGEQEVGKTAAHCGCCMLVQDVDIQLALALAVAAEVASPACKSFAHFDYTSVDSVD